jgi:hypothetical protein
VTPRWPTAPSLSSKTLLSRWCYKLRWYWAPSLLAWKKSRMCYRLDLGENSSQSHPPCACRSLTQVADCRLLLATAAHRVASAFVLVLTKTLNVVLLYKSDADGVLTAPDRRHLQWQVYHNAAGYIHAQLATSLVTLSSLSPVTSWL